MAALAERNRHLYEQMVKAASLKPTLTLSKLLALIIALLIHSVTLVFVFGAAGAFVAAVVAIIKGNSSNGVVLVLIGLFLALIAWLFAPKLGKWPKGYIYLFTDSHRARKPVSTPANLHSEGNDLTGSASKSAE